jgi:hypothetical protein
LGDLKISNGVIDGTHAGNNVKLADTTISHTELTNIAAYGGTPDNSYSLNVTGELKLTNIYGEAQMEIKAAITRIFIDRLTLDVTTAAEANAIQAEASGIMSIKNAYLKGFTNSGIRYDDSDPDKTILILDNIEIEGAASDDRLLTIAGELTPGHIQLGNVTVTEGNESESNGYTGTTATERLLQTNIGQRPRIFRYNGSPTWVAWPGDISYDRVPASGSPLVYTQEDRYETTVDGDELTAQTVISVADATGIADNDIIGIRLDSGSWHWSDVNGAPIGNDVTITDALPSQASDGVAFIAGTWLPGNNLP